MSNENEFNELTPKKYYSNSALPFDNSLFFKKYEVDLNSKIEEGNFINISSSLWKFYNEFEKLATRVYILEDICKELKYYYKANKYQDIYDFIDKNPLTENYVFKNVEDLTETDKDLERIIQTLLSKTFKNIGCIRTYQVSNPSFNDYQCRPNISLSQMIEELEEFNKVLEDEKNRDNRE